jgi:branched-chain amino acid transport system permease protein
MNYILHILIMITIYLILSFGLNLLVGFGGLLSLCQAAFYGIGAYSTTLLMMKAGFSFLPALCCSVVLTGFFALLIGLPALKFRGDSFVLVTLGIQTIVFGILYNWSDLTRGPFGIPGIPKPLIFGYHFSSNTEFLFVSTLFLLIIILFLSILYKSPYGLALKAMRDNEMAAEGLGKSPVHILLFGFVISGMVASIAGGLYASYVGFIDPTSFTLDESIFIATILIVGGSGNRIGPFLGTVVMILLPEILRYLGLPNDIAPNVRQMIYGLLLVFMMFLRPEGIAGEYRIK